MKKLYVLSTNKLYYEKVILLSMITI